MIDPRPHVDPRAGMMICASAAEMEQYGEECPSNAAGGGVDDDVRARAAHACGQ
jgi:hypothetical protein